ncbi:hypothetical protein RUM44_005129 [Polyplax serrata]|uniref:Uncharacterized protein n=1 Tax=Polyplax serrata TaxID=468196 RepID=A0ABR1AE71_POLSC
MPWVPPIFEVRAFEEFCRKIERIPDPLPQPVYDPPMTYFNNSKSFVGVVPYDVFYNFDDTYDQKSGRDDRRSLKPMLENIFKEEENKFIPVTSQLCYGRPVLLANPPDCDVKFPRPSATKDFYRPQGINITPELEQQPDH